LAGTYVGGACVTFVLSSLSAVLVDFGLVTKSGRMVTDFSSDFGRLPGLEILVTGLIALSNVLASLPTGLAGLPSVLVRLPSDLAVLPSVLAILGLLVGFLPSCLAPLPCVLTTGLSNVFALFCR